jgi:predicted CopG family antitoxin
MSVKTVALDPEAYEMLRRQKRPGETFSETVRRLTGKRRSILDFVGIWKDWPKEDFQKFEAALAEGRRRDRERMRRLVEDRE